MDDLLLGLVRSELDIQLLQYPRALSTVIVLSATDAITFTCCTGGSHHVTGGPMHKLASPAIRIAAEKWCYSMLIAACCSVMKMKMVLEVVSYMVFSDE
jgi:hypothetical protein